MIKDAKEFLSQAPLWLLLGLMSTALVFWLVPEVNSRLPDAVRLYPMLAAIGFAVCSAFKLIDIVIGSWRATIARRREEAKLQRETLYAPLSALLLDVHLTQSSSTGAPRFVDRVCNAVSKFGELKHVSAKFRAAWKALGDRDETSSVEIEYGGGFPISRIEGLVRANIAHADSQLVGLLKAAHRASYESPREPQDVSPEEYELACHIYRTNRQLEEILAARSPAARISGGAAPR